MDYSSSESESSQEIGDFDARAVLLALEASGSE